MNTANLKTQGKITREDIAALLASIGKPGKKRDEKLKAVQELERKNMQGHGLEVTLDSYGEW
jgi:hypothetical protein